MKIKQALNLYREFGPRLALSAVCASSFKGTSPWKHRAILGYLKEHYRDFIAGYRRRAAEAAPSSGRVPAPIWTMWWQGDDSLPEVVRLCRASVLQNCGAHPLVTITESNFRDYAALPDYVMDRFRAGAITITHLSDIIRFALLAEHGGLWLDSTVFVSGAIPERVFTAEYYTVRIPLTPARYNLVRGRWTNFLHAARAGCALCRFVLDFFLEYWKTHKSLIDYFLIDYAIEIANVELPECRRLLDAVPVQRDDLYRLEAVMNTKWEPAKLEDIRAAALFSKLAWRKEGIKKVFGHETVYGHLVKTTLQQAGRSD